MDFDDIPTGVALDATALEALERKATTNAKALATHVGELQEGLRSREATLLADLEAKVKGIRRRIAAQSETLRPAMLPGR